jgi:hypothetical protein
MQFEPLLLPFIWDKLLPGSVYMVCSKKIDVSDYHLYT